MNETTRLLVVQNPTISKNRFYSPSNFSWSRRCCGLQLCFVYFERYWENIFKKLQLLFYCNKLQKTADTQTSHRVREGRDTFRKQWNHLRPELCFEDVWLLPLCPRKVLAETFMVLIEGWGSSRTLFLKYHHEQGLTKTPASKWIW